MSAPIRKCRHGLRFANFGSSGSRASIEGAGTIGIPDAPTAFGNLRMSVKIGADGVDTAQLRELAAWGEAQSPVSCTLRARPSVAIDIAVV